MSRVDALRRVRARPSPDDWGDEEVMTLIEFEAVFRERWPLTVAGLRNAINKGRLTASLVSGSYWITPAAVKAMFECPASTKAPASICEKAEPSKARPFRTDTSSATDRLRLAQAAALSAWTKPKSSLPPTSRRSGPAQQERATRLAS